MKKPLSSKPAFGQTKIPKFGVHNGMPAKASRTGGGVKRAPTASQRKQMLSKKTKDELQRFFNTLNLKEGKADEESKKDIEALGESVDKKIKQLVSIECIEEVEINK